MKSIPVFQEINLPDKDYKAVSEMLSFLHPGIEFSLNTESAFRLIPLAEEYQINVLKTACEDTLIHELSQLIYPTTDFILKCMEAAENCTLPNLMQSCIDLFADPDIPLNGVKDSEKLTLQTKARVYESRINKMEKEREITESWKHRIVSVRVSGGNIHTYHTFT